MIERGVGFTLACERIKVGGEAALGQRGAVDHGDDSVDRDPTLDRRPVKRLDQRLRQRQAGRLDHDMLDRGFSRQDRVQGRHEVVRNCAAEAAVGQFDDVLLRTRLIAATLENFAVDADVAELVDDHGQSPPVRMGQDVPDQRRLPGPEETGHDGARHARGRSAHSSSSKLTGGTRAMSPRLSGCGLPRHGMMPSVAHARRRAPSTSAGPQATSRPPNT
jgi:hypothetical protein